MNEAKEVIEIARVFKNLGADEAKAQVMARQIIKRAERIAEEKESSKIDELRKLLEIAVLGAQGLLKPSDQAVLGPKKPPNA
ncbi:MAG: hypothetical protein ACJZ5X_00825 [Opitutales bacterium]|jgi:hypothetical protein|tara:strand:- start:465 stop:710 length:246 start_codon:yes stop_codon:yes gene_type:complete